MAAGSAFLLAAFLLNSLQAKGSEVFVLRGNDLRLDVKTPVELTEETDFFWKFGDIKLIKLTFDKKTTVFSTYKENIDFIEGNNSVLVKNVSHDNGGIYKAVVSGESDKTVTEYKVTIQDEVSSVKLTVTPPSSPSSCNLTVTCSTDDSNISRTFQCDNQNCSLKETNVTPTIQFTSIDVYLQQDYIICNHSNQVSWKHDERDLKSYCGTESGLLASAGTTIWIGTVVPMVLLSVACIFIYGKYKRKSNDNTGDSIPEEMEKGQSVYQNPAEDVSDLHPTSTYALVQFHTRPGNSAETTHTRLDETTLPPETVYAQVQGKIGEKDENKNI